MWRVSVGWKDQLAALKHVFPQFPTDTRHIWQRPNADFKVKSRVKNNCNCNRNIPVSVILLAVNHPRRAKLIFQHAETGGPEGFFVWHLDRAVF
ncbi:hypothetical protein SAMN04515618_1161 [Collimonas sp. OK307]|nr:hypothetical protein SAMN04515618_1161 [Collimonas sp. OK307]